jgi:plastocyanin
MLIGSLSGIACGSNLSDSKSSTPTYPTMPASAVTATKAPLPTSTPQPPTPVPGPPQTVAATLTDTGVTPDVINIRVGDTVIWTNNGSSIKWLVEDQRTMFNSGKLSVGQTFSYTFQEAGQFTYHDDLHASWTATVNVQ